MITALDVYFIEENEITSIAIRALIENSDHLRYVGHSGQLEIALADISRLTPHVVLIKINGPNTDVAAVVGAVRGASPFSAVVIKLMEDDSVQVRAGLTAGASGVLIKGVTAHALLLCLRAVGSGGCWVDAGLWKQALAARISGAQHPGDIRLVPAHIAESLPEPHTDHGAAQQSPSYKNLTAREQQILNLISQGLANSEIGHRLGIGRETVKTHVKKIMSKLGARTRTEAAVHSVRTESAG